MSIALTGDVMLGRLVNRYVITNQTVPPEALWGDVLPLLLGADRRLINLECVISTKGRKWLPKQKAFHFRANPCAIEVLKAARVDYVSVANNHVLDYGIDAMLDCLTLLDQAGIMRAGAGHDLPEAFAPAWLDLPEGRMAVVAVVDHEPEWGATPRAPGVAYVEYNADGLLEPYQSRLQEAIAGARRQARFVIVSAHFGPNWGSPSRAMRAVAHHIINLGADLFWGHSNHTPQGIEVYKGKFILYSAGDFVDDYAVDPDERNDLSFLFLAEVGNAGFAGITLHPVRIEEFRVRLARDSEVAFLQESMLAKCAQLGSKVEFHHGVGLVASGS